MSFLIQRRQLHAATICTSIVVIVNISFDHIYIIYQYLSNSINIYHNFIIVYNILPYFRGCRWMLVEGFGGRWFGNVWECLWFPMIFQSFLQHLWTLEGNSMKMAANLQKHVTSCCHLRATRIQRWTARARLKRPRRLVPKVCNLQLVPTMALFVKTPLSFYKFHIVPLCSIHFYSISFYFKLYPMISHLIPLIWIQHDGNWQNIIIHYPHMSTFLFYVVLFFGFIAVYQYIIHPSNLWSLLWHVWVVHGFSGAIWGYVQKDAEGLIMNFESFWYILIL